MENIKTVKKVIFTVDNEQVHAIDGNDVKVSDIEALVDAIALHYNISKESIVFEFAEVIDRDLSSVMMINSKGQLYSRVNKNSMFYPVRSVLPRFNIRTEEGYQRFLDCISSKNIDDAISFH